MFLPNSVAIADATSATREPEAMVAASQSSCSLMLVVEAGAGLCSQLDAVLEGGSVASVCILPAAGQRYDVEALRPAISIIQRAGAAALLVDDAKLARTLKADGVHLSSGEAVAGYQGAREILGAGCIVGADAGRSRDAAMRLGEDGADYIAFGAPAFVTDQPTARQRRFDLVQWWAEIFEVPCVAFDVDNAEDAATLAQAGADFVAVHLRPTLTASDAHAAAAGMLAALASRNG
jgi:thiamine-phosphate pyrophosphorylase